MKLEELFTSFRAPSLFLPELAWNPPEEEPFLQSNRVDRVIAHLAGYDGLDSQLLKATAGALHVAGDGFGALELALCGAGDKGLDDIVTKLVALTSTVDGMTLANYFDTGTHFGPLYDTTDSTPLADILDGVLTAVESIDLTLTDVWDEVDHHLEVSYTP